MVIIEKIIYHACGTAIGVKLGNLWGPIKRTSVGHCTTMRGCPAKVLGMVKRVSLGLPGAGSACRDY